MNETVVIDSFFGVRLLTFVLRQYGTGTGMLGCNEIES